MTELSILIYAAGVSGVLLKVSTILAIISGLVTLGAIVAVICCHCEDTARGSDQTARDLLFSKETLKKSTVVFSIFLTLSIFIPSKDTVYKLIAIQAASQIAKLDGVQELPENIIRSVNKVLTEFAPEDESE